MNLTNDKWGKLAGKNSIEKTIESLKKNGINAEIVDNKEKAKKRILSLIPKDAEIMTMTSVTLDEIGVAKEINESGKFNSIRKKLSNMDRKTKNKEMNQLGTAPEYSIGSVHAVTENGEVLIASNTGSQFPAYAYGSEHVIWVVGVNKIVKNIEQGLKRIYEHSLPLESERAKKAYGTQGSNVSKILIVNKEVKPNRINLIFINEVLGF